MLPTIYFQNLDSLFLTFLFLLLLLCVCVCVFFFFKNHNLLRNNLDYIREQLVKEEKFVRKEIEQIKLEQQNLKETLEKVSKKVDKLFEQRKIGLSKEQRLNNLLKQFENFSLGEKLVIRTERKINLFDPKV